MNPGLPYKLCDLSITYMVDKSTIYKLCAE